MPIYTSKGKTYNIPDDKVESFVSSKKDAELINNEPYSIVRQASTPSESNIQEQANTSTGKNQTQSPIGNNPLASPTFETPNVNIQSPALGLPKSNVVGGTQFEGKPFQSTVADAQKKMMVDRSQEPDYLVGSAIDEFKSYGDWIGNVLKAPSDPNAEGYVPNEVKDSLKKYYEDNFRDSNNPTGDVRMPQLVRDYLDKNKQSVPESMYIQGSSMFGGGSYVDTTVQKNTPEQLALMADFLVNSPKGRTVIEDEKAYLQRLDESIDSLEKEINTTDNERKANAPQNKGMLNYLRMSKQEREASNKAYEDQMSEQSKGYQDVKNARSQLNELKKLRDAYQDGDSSAIKQLAKEFGRRLPFDVLNAASLGAIGLTEESSLAKALKSPDNNLSRKAYDLLNEYQQTHQIDRSIAQDIAQGTSYMLPYIAQFAATEGLSTTTTLPAVESIAAKVGSGVTGKVLTEGAKQALKTGVRTFAMPQTLTDAYKNSIENPGSFLDSYAKSFVTNYAENFTETLGEYIPGLKLKGKTAEKIMQYTGTQGMVGEMAEEQIATVLHSALGDGQGQWSDLVDPRNQAVTFGTIAMMQLPYASIAAGGYAAGKARNIQQKRSINKGYRSNLTNMDSVFGDESKDMVETINSMIARSEGDVGYVSTMLNQVAEDKEMSDTEKDAIYKYTISYLAMDSLNKAKAEEVEQVQQSIVPLVEESANPQTGSLLSATIAGVNEPMQIVNGNIIQKPDGTIDRDNSDKEIYYEDAEGNRQVTSIEFIEEITENIPTQQAIEQATQLAAEPIIAQQENDEVRPYNMGETVRVTMPDGNTSVFGEISAINEDGSYTLTEATTGQPIPIEPRQIVNEDSLQGIEQGMEVAFIDENGQQQTGVLNDLYNYRNEGAVIINDELVPVNNVIGLPQPVIERQTTAIDEELPPPPTDLMIGENGAVPYNPNVSNSQDTVQPIQENIQSVNTIPSEQNTLPLIEQIPKDKAGAPIFEQAPIETTMGALQEVYSDPQELRSVVEATISNSLKRMDKLAIPKPTGDIVKDIANKKKASAEIADLSSRLDYWNSILSSIPAVEAPQRELTFKERLSNVSDSANDVRDIILHGIADGSYKFNWNGNETTPGLAQELGLSGSNEERRSRIGLLSNKGFTPETLSHQIWEETGGRFDVQDIRNEILDVLQSTNSRSEALNQLESRLQPLEQSEGYAQEQSDYEQQLAQDEAMYISQLSDELIEEDLDNLITIALENGASIAELDNANTASDFIDLIEQLEDGRQEQTSDKGRDNSQTETSESEGDQIEGAERFTDDRNRSSEDTGNSGQDQSNRQDGLNTPQSLSEKIAQAEAETNTNPTEAQKEAGNYKKGKVNIQGFDISIEQPRGSERTGTDESGKDWSITMNNPYGYIRKTEGKDGDHIDVFLGENPESGMVYVVDQVNPTTGQFDEHKVMMGFNSIEDARKAYLSNYEDGWKGLGDITGVDIESFRKWTDPDTKRIKPFAEYVDIQNSPQFQSSEKAFTPISEETFNELVDRLRQTGLARDVITDKVAFDEKINEIINDNATDKQVLSEMESIKQEAIDNGTFMLAPNGKQTNLNENQWLQVRTQPFIDWFGDWLNNPEAASKVVDDNGEPVVVYHGTNAEFTKFREWSWDNQEIYFSSSKDVSSRYGEKVMPIFLSIKEPVVIDAQGKSFNTIFDSIPHEVGKFDNDGLILENIYDNPDGKRKGKRATTYAISDNTQVKSSISNNGSFDTNNPDIRMQVLEESTNNDASKRKEKQLDTVLRYNPAPNDYNTWIRSADDILTAEEAFRETLGTNDSMYPDFTADDMQRALNEGKVTVYSSKPIKKGVFVTPSLMNAEEYAGGGKVYSKTIDLNDTAWIDESEGQYAPVKFMRTNVGDVYGFVTPDGTVYLDSTRMNANTPIHEFGHLWVDFIQQQNPDLYQTGENLILDSVYWDKVQDNPHYSTLTQEQQINEALAMAIGDKGASIVNDKGVGKKLLDWIQSVWEWIGNKIGIRDLSASQLEDLTLSQFTELAVANLLGGKDIANIPPAPENLSDNQESQNSDEAYFDAIEKGDIERARAIVESLALTNGYISINDHRMSHRAPSVDDTASNEKMEEGGDFNLLEIANGFSSQPSDYFDDARGYMYDNKSGYEAQSALKSVMRKIQSDKITDDSTDMPTITVYRAVPKSLKEGSVRNGDWVTPSLTYAKEHGVNVLDGKYRIISQEVPANQLWWDGNDIREWGVDDNADYAYRDTKNNRKLLEPITYDNKGNIIPPSKRFNSRINDVRFQSVHDLANATDSSMTEEMRNDLDKRLKKTWFRLREGWEDRHLAVKEFLDILRENGTEVAEHNDFYKKATHLNGKIDAQLEHYNHEFQRPLNRAISELVDEGWSNRDVENYAILKHGLERNAWMKQDRIDQYVLEHPDATAEQIARYEETLPTDYSGITAVEQEVKETAQEFVDSFEKETGQELIDNFWENVRAATNFSLQKQLEGGLIDKKTLDDLTTRYDNYIPLRGHDKEVAEDRWDYSPNMGTYFVAPLVKAKGRKSRSESPFAFIASMAQSAINSSNKNILNQTMLRLARKDKTGLMGVNKSWYEKVGEQDGKPIYEVRSAEYSDNPEQYRKNIEEFEERMGKLAENGLAVQSGSKLDIGGLFIKRNQADQHEIHVFQNGTEYTVYVNANPAVAQAINGSNAKELHNSYKGIAKVSRFMAANFTTRNPVFVLSNFSRDFIFSSSILPVKENAKYALQFGRNIPKAAMALQRSIRGKGDLTKQTDRYMVEYIMSGAKTGFSHILELQKVQKQIEREIKKGEGKNVFNSFMSALDSCNEFAENLSRFSVFVTSRNEGRSITQSTADAKEVTVNFNRSGSGAYGASIFRSLYLFVNAGIQALSNFAKVAGKNKAKTALMVSTYAVTGFLMPMITSLVGGGEGEEEYMKLTDWERQNNLCIYTGDGFIKIPLPHELRVFHKMGDNIYQAWGRKKDVTQTILDTMLGFADLIPANPTGAVVGGWDEFTNGGWAELTPDASKPIAQYFANRKFTGGTIRDKWADPNKPGYLKVKTNKKGESYAPAFLVKLAEALDHTTGGDGVKSGVVSFNPDVLEHVMKGYFGGLYNIGMQSMTMADKTYEWAKTGELKMKVRDTPLKTFYTSSDDLQASGSGLSSKYFKILDNVKETRRQIKGYRDQVAKGELTLESFLSKLKEMDAEKSNELYSRIKLIEKYESALKNLEGQDQKEAEKIIINLKKEVIDLNSKD